MRLPYAPKSGFGQFNHPILMEDEIQARVEDKPIDRRQGAGTRDGAFGASLAGLKRLGLDRRVSASS